MPHPAIGMPEHGDTRVATGARCAMFACKQANQQRILVRVIGPLPARRVHARRTAQRRHAQSRVFGQGQKLARTTVGLGFEDRVLGKRLAGFIDVEVDVHIGQTE